MKRMNSNLTALALVALVAHLPAGAATQTQVDQAVAGCKGNRGTSIGQMPWGATDADLASYKGNNLCTNNKGRPIGENCQKTLDKLYDVASQLNKMVKEGCEKFMPMFVGNKELQACMDGGQATCSETNKQQLAPVKAELAKFRVKLHEFSQVMNEQQKYVAQSSENVVQVLGENENARNTPAYNNAGYSASQMGVSSISESDKLNNFQDAGMAQAIVEGIKSRFENSDSRYANVSKATYDQHMKPIEDSFKEVEQLQSKVLREQLHGFIKAEELKLATKLYDNQLSETQATTNNLIAANEKSTSNMNSLGAATGAAPALAALGNQGSSGVAGGSSQDNYGGLSYGKAGGANSSGAEKSGTQLAALKPSVKAGSTGEFGEEAAISNSSSASRSPASASSLRDELRKKLAAGGGKNGDTTGASVAGGAAGAAGTEGVRDAKGRARGVPGSPGFDSEGFAIAGGGAPDPMLEGFNVGSLDQGGFYVPGSSMDESVKELVGEFESSLGSPHQMSNDIGASDGASLFARVREFHGRCLKRGCVTGTGKGDI
jgi:hypothetical protein